MEDEDYKLSSCGRLGGLIGVSQSGKFLGAFAGVDEALQFVVSHTESEQYWPNVWWVSDHGNAWLIDRDGNEIKEDE